MSTTSWQPISLDEEFVVDQFLSLFCDGCGTRIMRNQYYCHSKPGTVINYLIYCQPCGLKLGILDRVRK